MTSQPFKLLATGASQLGSFSQSVVETPCSSQFESQVGKSCAACVPWWRHENMLTSGRCRSKASKNNFQRNKLEVGEEEEYTCYS